MSFLGEALRFAVEVAVDLFSGAGNKRLLADEDWARRKRNPWRDVSRQGGRGGNEASRWAALRCKTCGRPLDVADAPLSANCGSDCRGCVGERELGLESGRKKVEAEIAAGPRNADGSPKP